MRREPRFEIEFKISMNGGLFTTYSDTIAEIKEGFWVDKDGHLSRTGDVHAYILPHMINYILKL